MNKKGQALVEYVLIIALISVVIIGLVNIFGGYLKDAMTKSSCNLVGQEYVEGKKPGEGSCKSESNWFVNYFFSPINRILKIIYNNKGGGHERKSCWFKICKITSEKN